MTHDTALIDPERPWIRDVRDDPSRMNWVQTLFNPAGKTTKLHFSRAWTFMFLGRLLLFFVPIFVAFIAGLAGADTTAAWTPAKWEILPVPALLVPFFVFTIVTEFTSWVAHGRRLAEAKRSPFLAIIVLLPLIFGMGGFAMGAMGSQQVVAQMEKVADARKTLAANPDDAEAAKIVEEARKRGGQNQQRGRGGASQGPPNPKDLAKGMGFGMAMPIWLLFSFPVMLWTLLYVARLPNGGEGKLRTGSDVGENSLAG